MTQMNAFGGESATGWRRRLRHRAARFSRDENGTFVIFGLYVFVVMLILGGLTVDFMHHENQRTRLQNTLDRAVLAAADLDQTLEPESVVRDYFDKSGVSRYLRSVNVDEGLNYREVNASAAVSVDTIFLGLVGIDSIDTSTAGTAEERVANVEISLVLDISGSMRHNSKIQRLRDAGQEFIDTVVRPETEDLISVSLVPYTAQVNAGATLASYMNLDTVHGYSHCFEFSDADFNDAAINPATVFPQGQHFEWSSSHSSPITNPGCPVRSYEEVFPVSQDNTVLKDRIDDFQPRANTSIHIGMKWGTALLDPAFRPVVTGMINDGLVDGAFAGRPADYSDEETLKTIVVMTDGENVDTYRIKNWVYNEPHEYDYWHSKALWRHLYSLPYSERSAYYFRKYRSSEADTMLENICDAAKAEGIVIWSIGFEVSNHGASVMKNCASTPSHFFRVEGAEISDAFRAIARQINQLRLTL